ncbi:probable pectinesterase/pectinesterase inhibitor 41, partial [Nymphaea colorata]
MTSTNMHLPVFIAIFTTIFIVLIPSSLSQNLTTPVPPNEACSITTNPAFCRSILPRQGRWDLYHYGRFLLFRSVLQSRTFTFLIDQALKFSATTLSGQAVGALEDCLLLSQLNSNFLDFSYTSLNDTGNTNLPDDETDELHTLLSAIVTNQQTCYDGLDQASLLPFLRSRREVYDPLVNGSELYRSSLDLFAHSWPGGATGSGAIGVAI